MIPFSKQKAVWIFSFTDSLSHNYNPELNKGTPYDKTWHHSCETVVNLDYVECFWERVPHCGRFGHNCEFHWSVFSHMASCTMRVIVRTRWEKLLKLRLMLEELWSRNCWSAGAIMENSGNGMLILKRLFKTLSTFCSA